MSEDEIITNANELIDNCNCYLEDDETDDETFKWFEMEKKTIQSLLDLYQKEKEKREIAEENYKTLDLDIAQACKDLGLYEDTIIADELVVEINKKFISKDKIKEIKKALEWKRTQEIENIGMSLLGSAIDVLNKLLEENNNE